MAEAGFSLKHRRMKLKEKRLMRVQLKMKMVVPKLKTMKRLQQRKRM